MLKIILNEYTYAERILAEGFIDRYPRKTLAALIKYYAAQDMDPLDIEQSIHRFMEAHYRNYNPVNWYEEIRKMIVSAKQYIKRRKEAGKSPLLKIEQVQITSAELSHIKVLRSSRLEKLAFVLLVYGKIGNQIHENLNYWVNAEYKDLFSDAKMTDGKKEQLKLLHKLAQLDYIEAARRVDSTGLKVLFANEEDEIKISLTGFDGFIYDYLEWRGEHVKPCSLCGNRMIVKSNRQKYCPKCRIRHREIKHADLDSNGQIK